MEKKLQDRNKFITTFAGQWHCWPNTTDWVVIYFFFFKFGRIPVTLITYGCFKDKFSVMNWKSTFFCLFVCFWHYVVPIPDMVPWACVQSPIWLKQPP